MGTTKNKLGRKIGALGLAAALLATVFGKENFFHKDYEETLAETYGSDYEETLVIEGGKTK